MTASAWFDRKLYFQNSSWLYLIRNSWIRTLSLHCLCLEQAKQDRTQWSMDSEFWRSSTSIIHKILYARKKEKKSYIYIWVIFIKSNEHYNKCQWLNLIPIHFNSLIVFLCKYDHFVYFYLFIIQMNSNKTFDFKWKAKVESDIKMLTIINVVSWCMISFLGQKCIEIIWYKDF